MIPHPTKIARFKKGQENILWFVPRDQRPWAKTFPAARAYCLKRYGAEPNTVILPPDWMPEETDRPQLEKNLGVKIVSGPVQAGHIFLSITPEPADA